MNGYPVVVTRVEVKDNDNGNDGEAYVEEKRLRNEKDEGDNPNPRKKFAVEIPAPRKVLNRGKPMEVDTDLDMGKSKNAVKDKEIDKGKAKEKTQTKTQALWEKVRTEGDITKVSNKILEGTIPNLTLKEVLSISPDLITEWFGVKKEDYKSTYQLNYCVTYSGANKDIEWATGKPVRAVFGDFQRLWAHLSLRL